MLITFIIAIKEVNDLVILYLYFYSVYIRTCFRPSLAVLSDGSAFNSPQPDLLPCTNGTESDRWPEGTNRERLTDTQTEESGEEEKEAGGEQGGMRMRVDSDRLQLVITGALSNGKASCL